MRTPDVVVELRACGSAVRDVTRLLRGTLTSAGCYELVHPACLAVTELVPTVLRGATRAVQLRTWYSAATGRLRVELLDRGHPGPIATQGRQRPADQYPFVAALATEWGVDAIPDGRLIWFEMRHAQGSHAPA